MHRKLTSATIARSAEDVFDFVTTPGYWPHCSPITLGIDAAEPWRPFRAGDRFTERAQITTWRGHVGWTVEVVDRPTRCVVTAGDHGARIEYTLAGDSGTTQLTIDTTWSEGVLGFFRDLLGFSAAIDSACEARIQTIAATLENPYLHGPQPDVTDPSWLFEADPLADDAVASLVSPAGDCAALEHFLGALYRGDPPPDDVPEPMRRFLEATAKPPEWTCDAYLDAASKVFLDWGPLSVAAHILASLPETYMLPRTAKLLNITRQLDAGPAHVDRRIWFTVRMCLDVLFEHGMEPQGRGTLAVQRLRLIHASVRMFVTRRMETPHRLAALSSNALWASENGKPISQLELLYTLLTFSHVVLRSFDIFGCGLTPFEHEAYIHIWNAAGSVLGVRPELLPRNAADAKRMFEAIKSRYGRATDDSVRLGRALIDFWTSILPVVRRIDALRLMQLVVATLLTPETVKANGLDQLPEFATTAVHSCRDYLIAGERVCSRTFDDAPVSRQAAALFVSLVMRKVSQSCEDQSGLFDVPDQLYDQWRGVAAAT